MGKIISLTNDLSLTGTCLLRKRDAFGFLCLLAGVVLFGGFSWAAKRQGGHKEGLDTPCLLILTESLISANWVGQFKQAQQSGVSHKRDMGANRQTAVALVLYEVRVTLPTALVKRTCSLLQTSKVLFWFQAWRHRSYNKRFFIGIDSSMKNL